MPRTVRTYMPSSSPSSIQRKPRPQRKTMAATRPRNGNTTASRLATHTAGAIRPEGSGGGVTAVEARAGRGDDSLMGESFAGLGVQEMHRLAFNRKATEQVIRS